MSEEEDGDGGFKKKTPKDRAQEKLAREDRRTVRVNRVISESPRKEL